MCSKDCFYDLYEPDPYGYYTVGSLNSKERVGSIYCDHSSPPTQHPPPTKKDPKYI